MHSGASLGLKYAYCLARKKPRSIITAHKPCSSNATRDILKSPARNEALMIIFTSLSVSSFAIYFSHRLFHSLFQRLSLPAKIWGIHSVMLTSG